MFTDIDVRAGELVDLYQDLSQRGRQSVADRFDWPASMADVLSKQNLFTHVMHAMEERGLKTLPIRMFDSAFVGIPSGSAADELNNALTRKGIKAEDIKKPYTLCKQTSFLPSEH